MKKISQYWRLHINEKTKTITVEWENKNHELRLKEILQES